MAIAHFAQWSPVPAGSDHSCGSTIISFTKLRRCDLSTQLLAACSCWQRYCPGDTPV